MQAREKHWVHAARIGAEVQLRLGHHQTAAEMFQAAVEAKALPWARLGIACAQIAGKDTQQARSTLESLLADQRAYVDAYDVMGLLQVEQGQVDKALDTYRLAAGLTPWSLGRLHKAMMALMVGQTAESVRVARQVVTLANGTKSLDPQVWMLLALGCIEQKDGDGVKRAHAELAAILRRDGETPRVLRMAQLAAALLQAVGAQPSAAVDPLRRMALARTGSEFDYEAAVNLVATIAAVCCARGPGLLLAEATEWVRGFAEETGNARILETATRTLQRYRSAFKDAVGLAALTSQVEALAARYGARA